MAVFGAKNPHTQFTVGGGVTCYDALTPERIKEFKEQYKKTRAFIENYYIPDLLAVAANYKECATYGGTHNFMAFGECPRRRTRPAEALAQAGRHSGPQDRQSPGL